MSRALGCLTFYRIHSGVNALLYTVKITFGEPPIPKNRILIWNLIQMYAYKNECVIQGKAAFLDDMLVFTIGMKRRLGTERQEDPWV